MASPQAPSREHVSQQCMPSTQFFFQALVARTRALNKKVILDALPDKLCKGDKSMICGQIRTAFSDLLTKQRNWKRAEGVVLKSPYDRIFPDLLRKESGSSPGLPVEDAEPDANADLMEDAESVANSDLNEGLLQLDLDSPVREVVAQAPGSW